jgi:CelD/BcsL family acetyltransferase involved in cellulose biosynthesis
MAREILLRCLKDKGLAFESRQVRYHHLRVEGTWDGFLRSQTKHFRQTFHVKEKDAFVRGRLTSRRVKNPSKEVLRETVFRVSEKSWQGQQGLAVASTEDGRRFYEFLADSEGEFDVDLRLIYDEEKCVSYLLGVVKNGIYHAFDTAFDDDCARYSLGYLALWSTIRSLFDEGITEFDYGVEHPYKYRYNFEYHDSSTLVLFRNRGVAAVSRLWRLLKSQVEPHSRESAIRQAS